MQIQSSKPYFPEHIRQLITRDIDEILVSGKMTMGKWVERLEDEFTAYTGASFAVALSSGTSALEILLRYYEVKDHEVIVPTNTFLASANAVIFAGGKPVIADIHPETLCLSPEDLRKKITARTRAVILVHIAGLVTPHLEEIRAICKKNDLILIEDAAHAAGSKYEERFAGNICDGAAFSFFPTKIMTTGEGGMLTTNDGKCADFARSLRCHGMNMDPDAALKGQFVRLGHNWRMSEIQAVIGYYQLKMLDEIVQMRNEVADAYRQELAVQPGVQLIECPQHCLQTYYKFPVVLNEERSGKDAINLLKREYGVQCGTIYWPPVHLQPFYQTEFGYKSGDIPDAEDILARTIALPIYPELRQGEVDYTIAALKKIL